MSEHFPDPAAWTCEAHKVRTKSDCPRCDDELVALHDESAEPRRRCDDCGEALVYMGLGVWECTEDRPVGHRYFIAPDGSGDVSLWLETDREPKQICRQFEMPDEVWACVVENMAGRVA